MPVNKGYPFPEVIQAAEAYVGHTGRQVTYEYILIAGKNDSPIAAELLAHHLRFKNASVNLIPANPVPEKGFARPSKKTVEAFLQVLQKNKINATIRREMGKDIDAAADSYAPSLRKGSKERGTGKQMISKRHYRRNKGN